MKKILLASVALLSLTAVASAADLPRRAAPPVFAPPIFTWTGFYIGAHVGYAASDTTFRDVDGYGALNGATANVFGGSNDNIFGGGQIGFNYQVGSLVLGVESDLGYMDLGQAGAQPGTGGAVVAGIDSGFYATFTGRLGFAADRFLIYVKGGGAYLNSEVAVVDVTGANTIAALSGGDRWGYTIGAGIEYAFTNNWTAKVEYAYFDFGRETATGTHFLNNVSLLHNDRYRNDLDAHTVKIGLNYKF